MNTAQRILKNTVALGISNVIDMANSIIVAILISRMLMAEGLGAYSTALAFFGGIIFIGIVLDYAIR